MKILPFLLATAAALPAADLTLTFTASPPEVAIAWWEGRTGRPQQPVDVDQRDRTFVPAVVAGAPGAVLRIHNGDGQQHNVFALDRRLAQDVDLGLGAPGTVLERPLDWPVGEVLRHGCKIHPDMRLWVLCTTSPQAVGLRLERAMRHATLRLDGEPGPVRLWLPRVDPVVVTPGSTVTLLLGGRPIGQVTCAP